MEQTLTIAGKSYEFISQQRGGTRVYRGDVEYLRIGPHETIERDLALHQEMEKAQFPVPAVLSHGTHEGQRYFIEAALGDERLLDVFGVDFQINGSISEKHFEEFVSIAAALLRAQENTLVVSDESDFRRGIRIDALKSELPQHADALEKKIAIVLENVSSVAYTITHGDLGPANMYADGIIDLEDSFKGPLGYDVVSALMTIDWFPSSDEFEFFAKFRFSDAQREEYMRVFGQFAGVYQDLAFCRAVWLCVGMHEWPHIQKWRYEKLVQEYLS